MPTIGEKIAKARKAANLTQDQLAALLEVSRQAISKWESDLTLPETIKILPLIQALGIGCDYLLGGSATPQPQAVLDNSGAISIDWTAAYPILTHYPQRVDCPHYHRLFDALLQEMMHTYQYSLEDATLVLKDLLYQSFLSLQKQG